MNRKKRFVSILLVVIMAITCLTVLTACDEATTATEHKEKAIIIVTALTSGGLYDTTTGKPVWDPLPEDVNFGQFMNGGDMVSAIASILTSTDTLNTVLAVLNYGTAEELKNNFLWQVSLNENGESNNPNLKPANIADGSYTGDAKIQYGALAAYRTQFDDLTAKYGDEYDVVMFNYDWRIDNRENSRLLGEFIEKLGYKEVIMTSHSMGGPVVSGFLAQYANANGVEALNKLVKCYYPFAGAFQGSIDALWFLDDTVQSIYDVVADAVLDIRDLGLLDNAFNALGVPLIQNMTSVMQLLPTYEFLVSEYYDAAQSCVMIGDTPIRSERDLYDFYCSRSFAKKADGSLKPGMASLLDYWHSFYVDGKHSTELVNTVYNVGCGLITKKALTFTKGTGNALSTDGSFKHDFVIYGDGDGTVPLNSALAGLDVEEVYAAGNTIHFYEKCDHGMVGCDWELLRADFYAMMDGLKQAEAA